MTTQSLQTLDNDQFQAAVKAARDRFAMLKAKHPTIAATPANHGLMKCYGRGGRAGAQAACLIRDTMKVAGWGKSARQGSHALPPPIAALFWIDPAHPEAGGSGHTNRACRLTGVPVVFQNHWETWLNSEP